ncbi:hypothetical protein O6H91_01G036000 [Diphasiastrum complanatum]|uniref:Uncharacterized protein n=5 Tax=Diphasiastrum complanatum TaxID=34168 RepID=A0ACC2EQ11_DIPCM|nr:hypothetical protein O6H91_01G036000 [Diphasiastrum complanatum]KAJ7568517.1 hypothetical protein O6H91_01G036000 [Diphasiastrum complanatum]KAJ7568518.1 hypothetical protein O6H91_01G036000 [Diphasiastrum complanatum]KAJ7568519.1 hypothetical protein O6H91_01G036000 [Diphasiastrum complanatum]KAJ7568520.1 hypothetical protein O6H91_01G036000 [Diphasiastrum complanatum]
MTTESTAPVDWEAITSELDDIDDGWKQAKFDSLPHVVQILTSLDPEHGIEVLKEQRDVIEERVDDVVRGYHKGFNKAIHNYSQILRLFGESTSSLSGLKGNLADSKKLLGTRHKQLQQLWYRSVTLRHVISLLDQIDNVAKVPARIEGLMEKKYYYAAVQLHVQSISMLEREGIQGVGALQEVRSELSKLRGILFFKVVEDLHSHLYNQGYYSTDGHSVEDKDDDISNIEAIVPSSGSLQPVSRRTRTFKRIDPKASTLNSGAAVESIQHPGSIDGKQEEGNHIGDGIQGGTAVAFSQSQMNGKGSGADESGSKESNKSNRELPPWLAESIPNEFTEAMMKSELSVNVKYLQTMVECLALLGKVAAAGAILSQRLRKTVHDLITNEIKVRAAAVDASRPRVDQVSKAVGTGPLSLKFNSGHVQATPSSVKQANRASRKSNASDTSTNLNAVPQYMGPIGSAQTAAQELVEAILILLAKILENHIIVAEALESKPSVTSESTFTSSSEKFNNLQWNNDPDVARATGGYSLAFVLMVLQSECQQLICDILRATPDAASADAAVQSARLASKTPMNDNGNGALEEGLSFAFRFTDTVLASPGGDGLRPGRSRRNANASQEAYGTSTILPERGIYLTAAVYRPVLQFTDKVGSLLPTKYAQLGKDGLQSFIENFLKDQFLPILYVDYRTRVADALASPSAFRPKSHPGSLYESLVEKERPILQGPLAADQLANEVLAWAQTMPKYAGEFVELVQTILERTLERCRAAFTEAVLGSLSSSLIGRTDVENLMKQDASSSLIEVSFLSPLGQKAPLDMPLDAEFFEVEMEMNNFLLNLRPIKQEQLITDDHKIVLLAALSDSLDYLSESIRQLGQKTSASSVARRKKDYQQQSQHHRRTSSALTSGLHDLAEKYHGLSAECLRTLRVEMQLEALYHLQSMSGRNYVNDQDAEEPEDFIMAFTSQIARRDEEMAPYIPTSKRSYVFGGICGISATAFVKAVNDISIVNVFGVRQICRNCIALQQALAALSSGSGESVQQRLDRVRTYYELLNMPFEALIAFVTEHETLFSFSEYSSLLKVTVPGREVPLDAIQRIGKILAPIQ